MARPTRKRNLRGSRKKAGETAGYSGTRSGQSPRVPGEELRRLIGVNRRGDERDYVFVGACPFASLGALRIADHAGNASRERRRGPSLSLDGKIPGNYVSGMLGPSSRNLLSTVFFRSPPRVCRCSLKIDRLTTRRTRRGIGEKRVPRIFGSLRAPGFTSVRSPLKRLGMPAPRFR